MPDQPAPQAAEAFSFDPDDGFMVEGDSWPFSQVGDWVLMSPISDRAVRVYCLLRAHVNAARDKRGDSSVWPSQGTLATVMGLSKADAIGKAIRELIELGAVKARVIRTPRGRLMVYKVFIEPPAGVAYDGPRCTADLYQTGVLEQLDAERVARRPDRHADTGR
jgi:hypothetical protein